jgi:hypothetical protein
MAERLSVAAAQVLRPTEDASRPRSDFEMSLQRICPFAVAEQYERFNLGFGISTSGDHRSLAFLKSVGFAVSVFSVIKFQFIGSNERQASLGSYDAEIE